MSALGQAASIAQGARERLGFVDALRASVVAFVIVHHAAQAYGPTGGVWPVEDPAQSDWFGPFYTVNSAFGLGLLFLLAGYFVPSSFDRRGARGFLKGRWTRLGLPLLLWALLVQAPATYLLSGRPPLPEFVRLLYEPGWLPLYAHLWFIAHLLLYSAAYAAWRQLFNRPTRPAIYRPPPSVAAIAGFVMVLAFITWIVRIAYPVDEWVPLFWIIPAEPAHLPQYVAFFAIGIMARRNDWFLTMPLRTGVGCLGVGLVVAAGVYAAHLGGPLNELMSPGGFSLSALARSTWETAMAAGLSVGLVVVFRELIRRPSRQVDALAAASFGAYLIHPLIVMSLQAALLGVTLPVWAKFACVSGTGIGLSFGIARLAGLVPSLRGLLGAGDRGA